MVVGTRSQLALGKDNAQEEKGGWEVLVMRKVNSPATFKKMVDKVVTNCPKNWTGYNHLFCGAVAKVCNAKKMSIDPYYVKREVVPRTNALIALYRVDKNKYEVGGFMLCNLRTRQGITTFYIDLICAKPGKGSTLMRISERFAKAHHVHIMTLHAATRDLIGYYNKDRDGHRFKRRANDCWPADTVYAARKALREVDTRNHSGYFMSKCLKMPKHRGRRFHT